MEGVPEDYITVEYLRDTAIQAGFDTDYLDVEADRLGPSGTRTFVDRSGRPIHRLFKLYPWEWIIREDFGQNVLQSPDAVGRTGLEDDPVVQVDPADAV